MRVHRLLSDWSRVRAAYAEPLGFVPTMGALHPGHQSLIERSQRENPLTCVSVFVNPTQFNDAGDLAAYPALRPEIRERDLDLCERWGATDVLLPEASELYRDGYRYQVSEQGLSQRLCGAYRPGHFAGMLTIVLKLLGVVRPGRAYFGEKDYQQLELVRGLVKEFFVPTEIVACPTVREPDGLAMSSRNLRLTPQERERAPGLYRCLSDTRRSDADVVRELTVQGFRVEYVERLGNRRLAAAWLGSVRLIDNVAL